MIRPHSIIPLAPLLAALLLASMRLAPLLLAALLLAVPVHADELLAPASNVDPIWNSFSGSAPGQSLRIGAAMIPSTAEPGTRATLRITGSLAAGFHIYSIHDEDDAGPGPTRVTIEAGPLALAGEIRESAPVRTWDAVFQANLRVHQSAFWLEQDVEIPAGLAPGTYAVTGVVEYQLCDNEVCQIAKRLPFTTELTVRPPR